MKKSILSRFKAFIIDENSDLIAVFGLNPFDFTADIIETVKNRKLHIKKFPAEIAFNNDINSKVKTI